MKIVKLLALFSLVTACYQKKHAKSDNLEYPNRVINLDDSERDLIKSIGIKETEFHDYFSSIIISEITTNSSKSSKKGRTPIPGLLFCGKEIGFDKISGIKKALEHKGLTLEVSMTGLSNRFYDLKFPFYTGERKLVDVRKYYYKVYETRYKKDFIEQIFYEYHDKTVLSEVYESWKESIKVYPIWADEDENVLLCPLEISDSIVQLIYEGRVKYSESLQTNLSKGWSTEESIKEDIRADFPKIEFWYF